MCLLLCGKFLTPAVWYSGRRRAAVQGARRCYGSAVRSFSDPRAGRRRRLLYAAIATPIFLAGIWRGCPRAPATPPPPAAPVRAAERPAPAEHDAAPVDVERVERAA